MERKLNQTQTKLHADILAGRQTGQNTVVPFYQVQQHILNNNHCVQSLYLSVPMLWLWHKKYMIDEWAELQLEQNRIESKLQSVSDTASKQLNFSNYYFYTLTTFSFYSYVHGYVGAHNQREECGTLSPSTAVPSVLEGLVYN